MRPAGVDAATCAVSGMVISAPGAMAPRLQVTEPATAVQAPPLEPMSGTSPGGTWPVATTPAAVDGPLLRTTSR